MAFLHQSTDTERHCIVRQRVSSRAVFFIFVPNTGIKTILIAVSNGRNTCSHTLKRCIDLVRLITECQGEFGLRRELTLIRRILYWRDFRRVSSQNIITMVDAAEVGGGGRT